MNEHIRSSLNLLRLVRTQTDHIGVALSFGKDSMCTLELCSRIFERIEAYYLFRVRDLAIVDLDRLAAERVKKRAIRNMEDCTSLDGGIYCA